MAFSASGGEGGGCPYPNLREMVHFHKKNAQNSLQYIINIKIFCSVFGVPSWDSQPLARGGGGLPVGTKSQLLPKNFFEGSPYHLLSG